MESNKSSDGQNAGTQHRFLVVGIGASAGGIQALKQFFEQVPADSGIAYVVILHLSPDHDSKLAEVLQVISAIPVLQVNERTKITPDHIYVVPPNKHLIIKDGFIAASVNIHIEERRAPVDIFFRNLADTHGPRSVCVILSGTGANGSMGLKRIKEMGGVAYVQNPREAEFNEMPRNSIATELVDEVLPVVEIPGRIIAYRNSLGTVQIPEDAEKRTESQQQAFRQILTLLRKRTGHDFTNYKRPTVLRRIERRINIRNMPDLEAYAKLIHDNNDEATALLKDLLISVTNFFRDRAPFLALEQEILPAILMGKKADNQVRIWVAGCATGEEAYSIAMLFVEQTADGIDAPSIQIFASDIDEAAIATAREGLYTINDAADVSPERLKRFFTQEGHNFRIKREIRELVLFANHNFLKDPPFSRLNLVTCRNVLIYLNGTAQERVMETFHFSLNPGGYLFLGNSESIDGASDLYSTVSRENRIYRASEIAGRRYPVPESTPSVFIQKNLLPQVTNEKAANTPDRISYGELHYKLLEQYAPPSVVINEEYDIVHMSEKAGKYFEIAGGEPTKNFLKLVRTELRLELRSALFQAAQHKMKVEARNLTLHLDGQPQFLDVHIRPVMQEAESYKGYILLIFQPKENTELDEIIKISSDEPMAKQLEAELISLKSQLRNSIQQHEFQAEELRASNEELQAMNEELRSSAEELETSKEELQSINEELQTVNQELKVKVDEISIASNNLQNLINSADVATVFLDRSFRIKMFTPAVLEVFNLIPSDYGRPISDITHKLEYVDLLQDASKVLEKLTVVDREITTTDHRDFLMRVLPYRTHDDSINGVVITFYEITTRKLAQRALQRSEEHLRLLIESAKDYAIFTLDPERRIVSWSVGAESIIGFSEADIKGKSADFIFTPEDLQYGAPRIEAEIADKDGRAENERWYVRKDGSRFWGSGSVSPLRDSKGMLLGYVKIMRDLTETKQLEEARFLLASIVDTSNDSIITIDLERKITSWNKAAEKLYGYTAKEAVGKNLTMLTLPLDLFDVLNNVDSVKEHRKVAIFDTVRLHKDGQFLDLEIVMSPVLNSSDNVVGVSTVARNISDRKRREKHLAFLADLSQGLITLSTYTHGGHNFTEKTGNLFDALICVFAEIPETENKVFLFEEWRRECNNLGNDFQLPEYENNEFRALLSAGQAVVVKDVSKDPRAQSIKDFAAQQIKSFVNIPFMRWGKWRYSLAIYLDHVYDWRDDELALLRETGTRIWNGLERTRAEEALRISEDRFRTVADAIPQVIWANDEKGKATYFNQRWFTYSGLTFEESYGLGWEAIVHPEDAPASVDKWHASLAEGKTFDTEYRLRNAKGSYCWHIGRNVPLKDSTGKIIGWFGSATDVENLKRTEGLLRQTAERLQLALDAGELGSYEYDFKTEELTCTPQQKKILGYAEDEPITYQQLTASIVPGDRNYVRGELEKAIVDKLNYGTEHRIQVKSGDIRWIKSVARLIYDEKGKPEKMVGITLDITEQKLFTEELRRQVDERTVELQRSNEDLRQFAHVASHDLKEPVRKIKTFHNRIIDSFSDQLPQQAKTYLDKIESATNRLYTMIEGVLAYSKLSSTAHALQEVDLNHLIEQIETDLELLMENKNATITKADLPTIKGNAILLYQLFYNLILNSLKFTKSNEPVLITINAKKLHLEQGEFVQVAVSDNGIGFDPAFEKLIFNTFTRLNPLDEYEGTGLGLALCKKIVERHNGTISASSRKNEGATFDIVLPVTEF